MKEIEKTKISIVTETHPPEVNGVARTTATFVRLLGERGYQVELVRPRRRNSDDQRSDAARELFVTSATVPLYRGLRLGSPAVHRLRTEWTRQAPAIVHVMTEGSFGLAAVTAARRAGIPVVTGFHTNFHEIARYYGLGVSAAIVRHYLKWLHNRADCTLAPTAQLRARLLSDGYRAVSVIGRGVDAAEFSPAHRDLSLRRQWGVGQKDTVALYVGRVAAEKNIELAIHAFRAMRMHSSSSRMVVVGDGPVRERLEKRHRDVIFTGTLRGQALARHYASADVFLFPSLVETFGTVVLEAMASGLAVVAFDSAAARDHLSAGDSAMLVPSGRTEEFTRGAVNLVASPEIMTRVRRNARKIAEGCDWESVIDGLETVYRQVCRRWANQGIASGPRPALGTTASLAMRTA